MKEKLLTIKSNTRLNSCTYEMVLDGEDILMRAGQFVELSIEGYFLRRPISVCKSSSTSLTLVYKVVGEGTQKMTTLAPGCSVNALIELGNGFDVVAKNPLIVDKDRATENLLIDQSIANTALLIDQSIAKNPLLVGGGIGSAPLFQLALEFEKLGIRPTIVLGFRNKEEIFYLDEFKKIGNVLIATDDGSFGFDGNTVSLLKTLDLPFDTYFACGPMVMMKYLAQFSTKGQMSLEARMGCGFGACMGCSILTTDGAKRVCKEGPVFQASTIKF